jgi:cell division protein FtsL
MARATGAAALAGGGISTAPTPLSLRLGRRAAAMPDARFLDRLVRGRGWIAVIAVALIGLVFLQVSLLRLNTGIGRAVTAASTLERQNAQIRMEVAKLDSGERIQLVAEKLGLVMPGADRVHYVRATPADGTHAARSITAPDPVAQQAATATAATATQAAAPATQTAPVAASTAAPATPTAAAPAASAAAAQTAAPAAAPTPPATQSPGTTPAPAAQAAPQTAATGGAAAAIPPGQ